MEVENEALLAQAKAWKDSAELSLKREEERLTRYREQLEKCKIYAPQDGMVAYHVDANRWGQSSHDRRGSAGPQSTEADDDSRFETHAGQDGRA